MLMFKRSDLLFQAMNVFVVHVLDMFDMLVSLLAEMFDFLSIKMNVLRQIMPHLVKPGADGGFPFLGYGVVQQFLFSFVNGVAFALEFCL